MKAVSRCNRATLARQWLNKMGILRCTDHFYCKNLTSKKYAVSVHLIIWLLGWKIGDLQWQYEITPSAEPAYRDSTIDVDADFADPAPMRSVVQ